jgi:hypothetical protein
MGSGVSERSDELKLELQQANSAKKRPGDQQAWRGIEGAAGGGVMPWKVGIAIGKDASLG